MPILEPSESLTQFQHTLNRVSVFLLGTAGMLLGFWEAKGCAAVGFGYMAIYSYVFALFLAVGLSIVGLVFTIYWRTRWVGVGLIVAALLSYAFFYAGMVIFP